MTTQPNFWHKSEEDNWIQLLNCDGNYIKRAPEEIRNSLKVAKYLLQYHPKTLKYFNENIKDSDELFNQSLKENEKNFLKSFKYFSPRLKNNKKIILKFINQNSLIYRVIDRKMRSDKEIILKMFKNISLCYKSQEYIPIEVFENDIEFLIECLKTKRLNHPRMDDLIKKDRKTIIEAVKNYHYFFPLLDEKEKNDFEIVSHAIQASYANYLSVGNDIKNDYELTLKLLKVEPNIYCNINEEFQNETTTLMVFNTIENDSVEFRYWIYLKEDLLINENLLIDVVNLNPLNLEYFTDFTNKSYSKGIVKHLDWFMKTSNNFGNIMRKYQKEYQYVIWFLSRKIYLFQNLYLNSDDVIPLEKIEPADSFVKKFMLKASRFYSFESRIRELSNLNVLFV